MEVTGHKLREALNLWELRRDAARKTFEDSLVRFPDEDKDPIKSASALEKAERNIATIQAAQADYNTHVTLTIPTVGGIRLSEAVKLLGGSERIAAMWRNAIEAQGGRRRSYYAGNDPNVRKEGDVRAAPTLSPTQITNHAATAAKLSSALRSGIAEGNTRSVQLDVNRDLFE